MDLETRRGIGVGREGAFELSYGLLRLPVSRERDAKLDHHVAVIGVQLICAHGVRKAVFMIRLEEKQPAHQPMRVRRSWIAVQEVLHQVQAIFERIRPGRFPAATQFEGMGPAKAKGWKQCFRNCLANLFENRTRYFDILAVVGPVQMLDAAHHQFIES